MPETRPATRASCLSLPSKAPGELFSEGRNVVLHRSQGVRVLPGAAEQVGDDLPDGAVRGELARLVAGAGERERDVVGHAEELWGKKGG